MQTADVIFHALIFDPPGAADDPAYLVSKVVFDIEFAGRVYSHLFADIRRPMTPDIDEESIEVVCDLPLPCKAFDAAAKAYYRTVLEPHGSMLSPRGPKGLRGSGNVFSTLNLHVILEVEDPRD